MAIAKATSITNKNPTLYVVHVYELVSSTYSIKQVFFFQPTIRFLWLYANSKKPEKRKQLGKGGWVGLGLLGNRKVYLFEQEMQDTPSLPIDFFIFKFV